MNKKEIESRLETLYTQKRLTNSAIEEYKKQLSDIKAEENMKISTKYVKKYEQYKGKIIVITPCLWRNYIFKCKDVQPVKSATVISKVKFISDGNVYSYDGTYGKKLFEVFEPNLIVNLDDGYHSICELKDLGYYDRRPILKLLLAAQGIDTLFTEAGVNRELNEDLVLKKK